MCYVNLQSLAKIIETTKLLLPSPHKQCWTNDTKVYCQVKFFSTLYRGDREVITEIERIIKSLIIFVRDCSCSKFEQNIWLG